jgi:hypothetical protein
MRLVGRDNSGLYVYNTVLCHRGMIHVHPSRINTTLHGRPRIDSNFESADSAMVVLNIRHSIRDRRDI